MSPSIHHLFREQTSDKGKRERTRSALLDSAISVFATKGYEATRITDITSHAGLANGTFYNYYRDKDELLRDVAAGLALEVTGRINDEMEGIENGATRVALATARMLRTARHEPEWLGVLLEGLFLVPELQAATVQYLRQDLEMGVAQGRFSITVDTLLINQITALIRVALLLDNKMSDDTIRRTCEAILRLLGVPSDKAEKQVDAIFEDYLKTARTESPHY